MKLNRTISIMIGMVIFVCCVSAWYYTRLPDIVPTHWTADGKINSYGSKWIPILIMPLTVILVMVLAVILPMVSPKQYEIQKFQGAFDEIMLIVMGFMTYLHLVIMEATANPKIELGKWLVGGILIFFAWMGNMLGKTRRNFFMGIRTPWTLASDKVWIATHRMAGKLMVIGGLGGVLGMLLGIPPFPCMIGALILLFYPVIYSLFIYKKYEREGTLESDT